VLCGFQQKTSSTQQKSGSKAASASGQKADAGKGQHGAASPGEPAAAADKNAVAPTVPRQNDKVEVTALPPEIAIKQVKDSIDRTIMWCTIILTFVGSLGTWAAVKTLRQVKRQADTLEDHKAKFEDLATAANNNAIAANASAKAVTGIVTAFVSRERARISVEAPSKLELVDGFFNTVKYRIHIFAPTPAIIVTAEVNAGSDTEETLKYKWTHNMGITSIDTRQTTVIERTTLLIEMVNPAFRQVINEKTKFIHFHGFIKYRDIFQSESEEPHETRFGYIWRVGPTLRADSRRWEKGGGRADGKKTQMAEIKEA
jgi:hypothetical protein